ncbi:DUF2339 domain-containing protein [Cellulophaga sp. Hel_I_12]|uniref:DUF2339 domain-containing protein n=1 Tax=Cellulophaga sp. Hel_I_12 TaxID=1249972 RepID=UPI000647976E|nr:DUF2339 domain-containing protein [Cellulophaga sp. Hel_I_12]
MNTNQDDIKILEQKLELLLSKQEGFAKELMAVYKEIELLKKGTLSTPEKPVEAIEPISKEKIMETPEPIVVQSKPEAVKPIESSGKSEIENIVDRVQKKSTLPQQKSNLEKFIGENLINKIGIFITVIGVVIGAKYSIENNLISPLTRIVLGYLVGLALLVFGIKLKAKYLNYSAVLVSGAIAILYFISFAAYSLYGLLPQLPTFVLMVLFTVFAVITSIHYNKQVIAHIGLVGAYAVPFLLSTGSGDVLTLFSYMAIINIGILVLAFKKYWKPLYYVAFVFTWLIYTLWLSAKYVPIDHFAIAFSFASLFFVIFYLAFMSYKFMKKESFNSGDVIIVFINSFIFYGIGFYLLSENERTEELLGLFTLANAGIHFVVATVIFKRKLADKKLFYLIAALVLTFITITIPVQLDGSWVTILWAVEAGLLFWIGLTKNISVYKKLSYILMVLAFFSIFQDWEIAYASYYSLDEKKIPPFFNSNFLSSLVVIISFAFITWLLHAKTFRVAHGVRTGIHLVMAILAPLLFLIIFYFAIFFEIDAYWTQLFNASMLTITDVDGQTLTKYNYSLRDFNSIWLVNYTLLFFTILSIVTIFKVKNRMTGIVNLVFNILVVFIFLSFGLYLISELRSDHINQYLEEYYHNSYNLSIRYISFVFLGGLLYVTYLYSKQPFIKLNLRTPFEIGFHFTLLWLLSSELLHWMDLGGISNSYKMNLSILWGAYSLFLVILGIWKRKKYLRITGIILFGFTLIKLFFYDIADLDTISKTIVFVSLGVLLLVISFLYNKYTKQIEDESKSE